MKEMQRLLETFATFFKVPGEQIRRESLKVIQQYFICLYEQIIRKQQTPDSQMIVLTTHFAEFMPKLTTLMLPMMSEYFDSVREEACIAAEYLICNFIPPRPELGRDSLDFINTMKAQLSLGWND